MVLKMREWFDNQTESLHSDRRSTENMNFQTDNKKHSIKSSIKRDTCEISLKLVLSLFL